MSLFCICSTRFAIDDMGAFLDLKNQTFRINLLKSMSLDVVVLFNDLNEDKSDIFLNSFDRCGSLNLHLLSDADISIAFNNIKSCTSDYVSLSMLNEREHCPNIKYDYRYRLNKIERNFELKKVSLKNNLLLENEIVEGPFHADFLLAYTTFYYKRFNFDCTLINENKIIKIQI